MDLSDEDRKRIRDLSSTRWRAGEFREATIQEYYIAGIRAGMERCAKMGDVRPDTTIHYLVDLIRSAAKE
jgi:hypothetical protein